MKLQPLVVLDAHGVVFNNPFRSFLGDLARRSSQDPAVVWHRWLAELREPFWEGQIGCDELWAGLAPDLDPSGLVAELHERHTTGPLFDMILHFDGPIWLLTNHRTEWILPRLTRFGLENRFEQVLISDHMGAAKPSPAAFAPLLQELQRRSVWYVDDSARNVAAARSLGLHATHISDVVTRIA